VRLLFVGIALAVLLAVPRVGFIVYAVGPAPSFQAEGSYISVGSNKYYIFSAPRIDSWVILALAVAVAGYYEVRKGVRPRGSAISVAVLSAVLAAPLPLIFSEQSGLTIVAISNAYSSTGPVLFLAATALELAEHYMLPRRSTRILATPDVALEKTEKA
jgi:hypothetical protein